MPRMTYFICSGICLPAAFCINAQVLPRNPTMQQLIGYRLQENRQWQARQLPKNSALFKSGYSWQLLTHAQKSLFSNLGFPANHAEVNHYVTLMDLQNRPSIERSCHAQWTSQRWWREPANAPGAGILRGLLVPQRSWPGH